MPDTTLLERQIGSIVEEVVVYLFTALCIEPNGTAAAIETLRPLYPEMALIYVDTANAAAVMAGALPIPIEES